MHAKSRVASVAGTVAAFLMVIDTCSRGEKQPPPPGGCVDPDSLAAGILAERADVRASLGQVQLLNVERVIIRLTRTDRYIIALSWDAPAAGAILLLSCHGQLLQALPLPNPDSLWIESFNPPLPEMIAVRSHETGVTSSAADLLALIAVEGDSLRLSWRGTTLEGAYSDPNDGMEERATVQVDPSGTIRRLPVRQRVRLDQKANKWLPDGPPRRLPAEEFHWDPATRTFRRLTT